MNLFAEKSSEGAVSNDRIRANFDRTILYGPFLLGCIFLAAIIRANFAWEMPCAGLIGLFLCIRLRWAGFSLSLVLLACALFHQLSIGEEVRWNAILFLSIVSSLLLTTLCSKVLHEEKNLLNKEVVSSHPVQTLHQAEQMLGSCLAIEKVRVENELTRLKKEGLLWQSQLQALLLEKQTAEKHAQLLKEELSQAQIEYSATLSTIERMSHAERELFQENRSLQEQSLKSEAELTLEISRNEEQGRLINELIHECRVWEEKSIAFEKECGERQNQIEQLKHACDFSSIEERRERRRFEGLYLQLREQFIEKTSILDTTRRELFHVEERMAALQKDLEEEREDKDSELQQEMHRLLSKYENELKKGQEENAQLHELIRSLIV